MLEVRDLGFAYGGDAVLEDIGFSVERGEILVILGRNGAGKTTLLKCINRIFAPGTGTVMVRGRSVRQMRVREISKEMAYVAQNNRGGRITVFDAVRMGRTPHLGFRPGKEDFRKTDAVLARLNLTGLALKYLDRLSGGELQKVAIARALVQETDLLLMDEPTSSLDLKNQTEILELVRDIALSHNIGVVMTIHDLNAALRYADQYICLKDHRVFGAGKIRDISPDLVGRVYGIKVEIITHNGYPMVIPVSTADRKNAA